MGRHGAENKRGSTTKTKQNVQPTCPCNAAVVSAVPPVSVRAWFGGAPWSSSIPQMSWWPCCAAYMSAVTPEGIGAGGSANPTPPAAAAAIPSAVEGIAGSAPASRRSLTIAVDPCSQTCISAVEPFSSRLGSAPRASSTRATSIFISPPSSECRSPAAGAHAANAASGRSGSAPASSREVTAATSPIMAAWNRKGASDCSIQTKTLY